MKNLKIKIITGFRKDQHLTIDADEAHKAYFLFLNPEQRGVFKNGIALIGADIRGIEPDYNATMGWNPDHTLQSDDWNELRKTGMDRQLRDIIQLASDVAKFQPEKINLPLSEIKLLT
jgi:hypothetical protein